MTKPRFDRTHHGSCVVCARDTDTGVALIGPAEWVIAALMHRRTSGDLDDSKVCEAGFVCDVDGPAEDITVTFLGAGHAQTRSRCRWGSSLQASRL